MSLEAKDLVPLSGDASCVHRSMRLDRLCRHTQRPAFGLDNDSRLNMTDISEDTPLRSKNFVPLKDRLSWSPEESAAMTGIGLTRMREAARSGSLVARKHGKKTVILPDDLKNWLKALPRMDRKQP